MPLWTSDWDPLRMRTTLSQEPVSTRVFCRPSASIRIAAKTKTTSAMPAAVRIVVNRLVQRFRKLYETGTLMFSDRVKPLLCLFRSSALPRFRSSSPYPIRLSPSAMRIRTARHVGNRAATTPTRIPAATPMRTVSFSTKKMGK
ncbi:MAG: hypothetical protein A4E67_01122 [Syntrophaceae bacterium PtaB.Bin038]|nr:MAG: hypothetical protein A4E67_01122 [Syntrophaceae bacterium PtaB.Bin038]